MKLSTAAAITVGTGAAVFSADMAVKYWFRANVPNWQLGPTVGPFTTTHVEHPVDEPNGFNSASIPESIGGLALAATMAGVGVLAGRFGHPLLGIPTAIAGGLILGAAASNNGELLVRHSVTDYLDVPSRTVRDPVLGIVNLSDVATGIGAAMFVAAGAGALGVVTTTLVKHAAHL